MSSPCVMCSIHGAEYSEENCKECDFEIAVKQNKKDAEKLKILGDELSEYQKNVIRRQK